MALPSFYEIKKEGYLLDGLFSGIAEAYAPLLLSGIAYEYEGEEAPIEVAVEGVAVIQEHVYPVEDSTQQAFPAPVVQPEKVVVRPVSQQEKVPHNPTPNLTELAELIAQSGYWQ